MMLWFSFRLKTVFDTRVVSHASLIRTALGMLSYQRVNLITQSEFAVIALCHSACSQRHICNFLIVIHVFWDSVLVEIIFGGNSLTLLNCNVFTQQ